MVTKKRKEFTPTYLYLVRNVEFRNFVLRAYSYQDFSQLSDALKIRLKFHINVQKKFKKTPE